MKNRFNLRHVMPYRLCPQTAILPKKLAQRLKFVDEFLRRGWIGGRPLNPSKLSHPINGDIFDAHAAFQ